MESMFVNKAWLVFCLKPIFKSTTKITIIALKML